MREVSEMREAVDELREVLHKVDERYFDVGTVEVRKLNDDIIFALRDCIRGRNKLLGGMSEKEVSRRLGDEMRNVRSRLEAVRDVGIGALVRRLEAVKEILEEKVGIVERKREELREKRLQLEARAKSLIRDGRVEDAEAIVPEITSLEENEKILSGFMSVISKIKGRISGLLTKIDVLNTVKGLKLSELNLSEVRNLKSSAETVANELNEIHNSLGSVLSMSGTGILSGTLSEKERKTLERLVAEVGDVSEAVRVRLREMEDAEKKLVEMKK